MVDIDTGKVIDILDSREIPDVIEWLKSYSNLKVISRDGSMSYANAISQAHPSVVQISDRFHLIKNLTDAAKKYIIGVVKANFRIPIPSSQYSGEEKAVYWQKETTMDFPTKEHEKNVAKKMEPVMQVRDLKEKGYTQRAIAKEKGISHDTVKKYLSADFNPVYGNYDTRRKSKIKPYTDDIREMICKGYTFKKIEENIRQKGYDGAASTIRMYATRERKLMKSEIENSNKNTKLIERKWLVNLLYHPLEKIKELSEDQLYRIIVEYPIIGKVYDIIQSFKEILFAKKTEDLDNWINEADLLEIDEINSFIGGISRDIGAVKNAIKYEYSNGLAEGSVNKLELIKRIMYGRNSYKLLKSKQLRLELKRKIN